MRTRLFILYLAIALRLTVAQSSIVFETGTAIEVTGSADICADLITINGSYSGDGTQCNGPLPVELAAFTVIVKGRDAHLHWSTATESGNSGFEIERASARSDGTLTGWQRISFVRGAGNSNTPVEYAFTDRFLQAGGYRYRLKQIDDNGAFHYSQSIESTVSPPRDFALFQNYPNPFNPITRVSYQIPDAAMVNVTLYDNLGREILKLFHGEQEAGYYDIELNAAALRLVSGIYYYRLTTHYKVANTAGTDTKKMVLMK